MAKLIRRVIVVVLLAAALSGGIAASAGAGEWCIRLRPGSPLDSLSACVPTNY